MNQGITHYDADLEDIQSSINELAESNGLDISIGPVDYSRLVPVQMNMPMPVPTKKDTIKDTFDWFIKAVPAPEDINRQTQLGVHMEEFVEMLQTLKGNDITAQSLLRAAIAVTKQLADYTKASGDNKNVYVPDAQKQLFLDSLCDQVVTATGCGHMHAMDIPGALGEVNRSNYSKFDPATGQPIFNTTKKVMKGPAYTEPNLIPFIH